jgi:hypothetical protein
LDFRTQFYKGYKFENDGTKIYISNLMAPGYVSLGFGMNYKPTDYFELMVAPLSNRVIFVLDDSLSNQGAFGVDKGEKIKVELGGSMNATLKYPIMENIVFQTRLSIFAPYSNFTSAIVNSETLISMKVNSTININLNIDAIYDERVVINRDDGTKGPATQFRNVLAIGFGYKF